jgi:hypothetical protein
MLRGGSSRLYRSRLRRKRMTRLIATRANHHEGVPVPRAARSRLRAPFVRLLGLLVVTVLAVAGWQVLGRDVRTAPVTDGGPILTTASALGSPITKAGPGSVLVGPTAGVRLVSYGFIQRYQFGAIADQPRTAPAGRRLIAFSAQPAPGEEASTMPALSIRVGAEESGPLVSTANYVVASVPMDPTNVDLVLTDGGVKQSISLLTGQPSAANPAICSRLHRMSAVGSSVSVSVKVKALHASPGVTSGTFSLRSVSLSYWGLDGSHPSDVHSALLHVGAVVTLAGDPTGYGAEAGLLSATSTSEPIVGGRARNAAPHPATQVDDVIEVSAELTSGLIHYSGTISTPSGEVWVLSPVSIPFVIPAG